MTDKYPFIALCPPSGASLLSALIGNISSVEVVQDLCLIFYLKKAALLLMIEALSGPVCLGKYVNYVGSVINPGRGSANRSMVSESEKAFIYEELSEFCEKYSYGKFAAL